MAARRTIAGVAVLAAASALAVVAGGPALRAITADAGILPRVAAAPAGATTPFTSYEAEAGALGGGASIISLTAAPTTPYSSAALEASGHAYVHLGDTGQSVAWTNNTG